MGEPASGAFQGDEPNGEERALLRALPREIVHVYGAPIYARKQGRGLRRGSVRQGRQRQGLKRQIHRSARQSLLPGRRELSGTDPQRKLRLDARSALEDGAGASGRLGRDGASGDDTVAGSGDCPEVRGATHPPLTGGWQGEPRVLCRSRASRGRDHPPGRCLSRSDWEDL
jgi:hypothetical protein